MKKTFIFMFAAATAVTLCSMTDAAGSKAMRGPDSLSTVMIHDSSMFIKDSSALPEDSTAFVNGDGLPGAIQDTARKDTSRRDTTSHRW